MKKEKYIVVKTEIREINLNLHPLGRGVFFYILTILNSISSVIHLLSLFVLVQHELVRKIGVTFIMTH
jgi:hypothetical protein